jgi:hypothetical protein
LHATPTLKPKWVLLWFLWHLAFRSPLNHTTLRVCRNNTHGASGATGILSVAATPPTSIKSPIHGCTPDAFALPRNQLRNSSQPLLPNSPRGSANNNPTHCMCSLESPKPQSPRHLMTTNIHARGIGNSDAGIGHTTLQNRTPHTITRKLCPGKTTRPISQDTQTQTHTLNHKHTLIHTETQRLRDTDTQTQTDTDGHTQTNTYTYTHI